MAAERPIIICTRGSAMAMAQSNMIAAPRDIDDLDNVYLYNVDDLQSIAADYLNLRKEEVAGAKKSSRRKLRRCWRRTDIQPNNLMAGVRHIRARPAEKNTSRN